MNTFKVTPKASFPDTDLEEVHEEKFGIRPQDLPVALSEQGRMPHEVTKSPVQSVQTENPTTPKAPEGPIQPGEGSV